MESLSPGPVDAEMPKKVELHALSLHSPFQQGQLYTLRFLQLNCWDTTVPLSGSRSFLTPPLYELGIHAQQSWTKSVLGQLGPSFYAFCSLGACFYQVTLSHSW